MRQNQLNREVAARTGESVREIARRGFVPLSSLPIEREPEDLIIDWDALEARRYTALTGPRRREPAAV
jgi:hypothetical protein